MKSKLLALLLALPALAVAQTRTVTTDASGNLKQSLTVPSGFTLTTSGTGSIGGTFAQTPEYKTGAFTAAVGHTYIYSGSPATITVPNAINSGEQITILVAGGAATLSGTGISGTIVASGIPTRLVWLVGTWTIANSNDSGTGVYVRQTAPTIDQATLTNSAITPEFKNAAFTAAAGRTYVYAGSPQTMTVPNGTANGQRITLVVLSGSVTLSGTGLSGSVVPSGVPTQLVWNSSAWSVANANDTGTGAYVRAASPTMTTDALISGGGTTFPTTSSVATQLRGDARWANIQQTFNRQGRDFLLSDGKTTDRRVELKAGAVQNVAGGTWTYVGSPFQVFDVNVGYTTLFAFTSSNSAAPEGVAWSLGAHIDSSGKLIILQNGATPATDYRTFTYTNFRSDYSGVYVRIDVAFSSAGTTPPTVWINGVDKSASFTSADGSGTDPNWCSGSTATTYFLQAYNWPQWAFTPGRVITRKFAQADVDRVQTLGQIPPNDGFGAGTDNLHQNGNAAAVSPYEANSTGNSLSGVFNVTFESQAGDIRPGTSGSYAMHGLSGSYAFGGMRFRLSPEQQSGAALRVKFWLKANAAFGTGQIQIMNSFSQVLGYAAINIPAANTWYPYDIVIAPDKISGLSDGYTADRVGFVSTTAGFVNSGSEIWVDDLEVSRVGAVADPIIQPCLVLDDGTPNGNCSLLVGFTANTSKKDWRIVAKTNTNGNQQLLGGSVFNDTNRHRIDSLVVNNLGTSKTVSIGNASAGTQYVSSGTAAAGLTDFSPATRFNATANLWINSNGTDNLTTTITGHRVGN